MDRSWRWRQLPGQAEYFPSDAARASEPIASHLPNRVYPETVRLREGMTIHVKGTQLRPNQSMLVGRWYQRYLPADNQLVPPPSSLTGSRPTASYAHDWKFLPEPMFQAADRFSHFGVYTSVDSRTQYYVVIPASDTDAQVLDAGAADAAPWVDTGHLLCTRLLEFQWAAPLRWSDIDLGRSLWSLHIVGPPKSPPSLFNPETRLRIVRRGTQWIAMHWDKRNDDLIPFDGLPCSVTLSKGAYTATVTLQSHTWVEQPPAVHRAEWAWTGDPQYPVMLALSQPTNVWRVHLALVRYCTAAGALQYGTSLWFEDLVGHVSVPDELWWSGTPPITASETFVAVFI
jgi:hypothetical protein